MDTYQIGVLTKECTMVVTSRERQRPERTGWNPVLLPALLFATLLLIPSIRASALAGESAVWQQDPEQFELQTEEMEFIRRDIEVLTDSLQAALQSIEGGRETLENVRKELKRLEDDLNSLDDQPGLMPLKVGLAELRRLSMDAYFRRGLGIQPDIREMMDPEMWREMAFEGLPDRGTTTRRDIFVIGDEVEIGVFEKVIGDVVVIGNKIVVHGSVTGSVISIFGDVHVTSTGRVDGDAVTVGGQIHQDVGGTIRGSFIDTHGFIPNRLIPYGIHRGTLFAISLAGFLFLLTLAVVVGLIAPKHVERVENQVTSKFGVSFLIGLATEILLPVAFLLLMITVIGIPVAVLFLPLAMIALFLLGFTGVAKAVGSGASDRGLRLGESPLTLIFVGVILIEIVYIIGRAIGIGGDFIMPISFATRLIGGIILYVAWTTGLGAALMTRFGTRTPGEKTESAPKEAPPPTGAEVAI